MRTNSYKSNLVNLKSLGLEASFRRISSTNNREVDIKNTRSVSFDIKFTRQGFENAC